MTAKLQALWTLQDLDSRLDQLVQSATTADQDATDAVAKEAKKLRARRQSLVPEVGSELFDRYEQLRRRHRRAIAQVRRGVCLGCNMVRPTKSLASGAHVDTCERCGRILLAVEEDVTAPTSTVPCGQTAANGRVRKRSPG